MLWLVFVPMLCLSPLAAQQSLTMQNSVQFALQNNPQVQKAALEVQKGDYQIKEYLAVRLPQLNGSGNFTFNAKLPTQLIPNFFGGNPDELLPVQFGTALSVSAGLELSQLVYDHGVWLGVKATDKLATFNRLIEAKTQEDVAYNVVKIYMQAQILGKQRGILEANLLQVEGLLRATELQFQNGFAKKLDVDQLRVNRSTLRTQLDNLNLQYEQSLRALKFAMAMPLDAPITLADTLQDSSLPTLQTDATPGFGNKIDLAIVNQQRQLLDLQLAQTRANYLPSARFFANYAVQGQGNGFGDLGDGNRWFDYAIMGINLRVPIFDGFRKGHRLQQNQIELLQNEKDRQLTQNSLEFQYQNAQLQLQSSFNSLRSQKENLAMAEEVYAVMQKRFREGIAPITEVLNAETSMREVQTNYLAALLQYKWASLDLEYANGKLLQLFK
ncbi:MAG TPA: TolC family protein [Saprospiraceae bacterium]|nr:TolC family protein [Saprospiraceae bacterium]